MKYTLPKQVPFLCSAFLILFFMPQLAPAQLSSIIPEGLGFEIGAGHNQLFWKAEDFDGKTLRANRTALSVLPSARIHYTVSVTQKAGLYTFVGYNEFGGRSTEGLHRSFIEPDVLYKDRFRFQNLEAGVSALYRIAGINAGLGAKVNHHLRKTQRYHFKNHPMGRDGWQTSGFDLFKDWSADGGIRIEYALLNGITLAGEGWFGLTELSDMEGFTTYVRQNHYRFLIGYRL
jgi:hypothetical protein